MKLFVVLFYPLAVLFNVITSVRNRLYDLGLKPSVQFDIPVISVGNLAVGGTAKTPMIEHLIRLLSPTLRIATLSRGYKRSTRGFRMAQLTDSAFTIGDEPYQLFKKFGDKILVAVGEERVLAIPQMINANPGLQVILLDDAFQHRSVKPIFRILLTDHKTPFYNDFLLPAGRLREARKNASRADVIVVSKCPMNMTEDEMLEVEVCIRKYSNKPVFFSSTHYAEMEAINGSFPLMADQVVLVSGIADASSLHAYITANHKLVKHFDFADHHRYTAYDLKQIVSMAQRHHAAVITTEKDAVKILDPKLKPFLSEVPFFYLPIEVEFLKNRQDFDEMVLNAVKNA